MFFEVRDFGGSAKFASHHDQRGFQFAGGFQILNQSRNGLIHRRQKVVFQVRESVAVCVPSLVIAKIYLHQWDSGPDHTAGNQATPAKAVLAVAIEQLGVRVSQVESLTQLRVG